jgi:hypothetical protein
LHALKQLCRLAIEHFTRHAGEDQLAGRISIHSLAGIRPWQLPTPVAIARSRTGRFLTPIHLSFDQANRCS